MLLQLTDIATFLKQPFNAAALAACRTHEQRIRLHADAQVERTAQFAQPAMARLLALPKAVLPAEKYEKFEQFIPCPLPTVKTVGKINDGLSRVFEAQDGSVTVELATAELETDFESYRTAKREQDFWPGEAFEAIGRAPHSLLVVDMAATQTTPRPEPYTFLLDIADVVDTQLKADGSCEYLLFSLPSGRTEAGKELQRLGVYDDGFYRIFEKTADEAEWPTAPVLEHAHILGYCPARMLWSEALGKRTDPARQAVLTKQLGDFDRYVLWDACIEYFELYGVFPPLWSFEEQCAYEVDGQACTGGIVQVIVGYDYPNGQDAPGVARYRDKACPVCAANKYLGPGTHVKVPAPTAETGDTRDPMGFVAVDVAASKNAREKLESMQRQLLRDCLGSDGEPTTAQPRNELDVQAGFEQQQDVLKRVAGNLDIARSWVLSTWGKLRYGPLFRRALAQSGQQYYLKTPTQLSVEESEARKAGRPTFELSQARELRYFTQYRNNPPLLDRMRILSDLEPWPEFSLDQLYDKLAAAGLDPQGSSVLLRIYDPQRLALKADFPRFIVRFESEQTDVRLFAALQPYHLKLALITQILLSYVTLASTPENGPQGATGAAAGS